MSKGRVDSAQPDQCETRMKLAYYRAGVLTVAAGLGLLGCETWRGQSLRQNQSDDPNVTTKISDVDASIPKNAHASGARTGTWSQEAREIEGHFNVGR